MSRQTRSGLLWLLVVTLGRAACVLVVAGGALAVSETTGSRPGRGWLWLAATVLVAGAVMATRRPVEGLADRVAYGPDGDPYARLSGFVQRISQTLAVDDVLPRVAQTVTQATHTSSTEVRLWLADGAERRVAWPVTSASPVTDVAVPLQHHGEEVGVLGVSTAEGPLTDDSRQVLERLAGTAGLALANVRLAYDLRREIGESRRLAAILERSRQRLLAAAAEQTSRFSFVVDGQVQSHLRAAGRGLDQVERGDRAGLEDAAAEATSALEALRDIAAGVFPPTLSDNGLRVALEAFALRYDGRLVIAHHGHGGRYSSSVEAAAYLCSVEVIEDCTASDGAVQLDIEQSESSLRVGVRSTRAPSPETVQLVEDRVEATDGVLERRTSPQADERNSEELVISWRVTPLAGPAGPEISS